MKRKVIKTVNNAEIDFIPTGYGDFDLKAADIYERPLIFVGKRLTRDQYFEFQELIKAKYPAGVDASKLSREERLACMTITGKNEAYKYVWNKCIVKLKNVIMEIDGAEQAMDECLDKKLIWEKAAGLNAEIMEALAFFIEESTFSEAEEKN